MANLNFLPMLYQYSGFWAWCPYKNMTNLCSLFIKHVSRTTFMYSYRIPPQISGFGNIKSSYVQFELFAGIITVLRLFARCPYKNMTNLCSLFIKHVSRTTFMYSYRIPPQISGFGNIKSSYGLFEPFAGIITVLRLFAKMSL